MRIHVRLLIVFCLAAATSASATVFQSMPDRDLVDRSQAVVIATVRDSISHVRSDGYVVTESHLAIEEALKGSVAGVITVSEVGGATAGRVTFISDSAVYAPGERVLVFLRARGDGTYFTTSMAMGKFSFTRDERGETLFTRDVSELSDDPSRLAGAFTQFVRERGQGRSTIGTYETKRVPTATARHPITAAAASAYVITGCGGPGCFPVRVAGGEAGAGLTFRSTGTLAGVDGPGGIASAAAAWTNDPGAGIVLSYAGAFTSAGPDPDDGQNGVYLGYSGPDNGFCDGTIGCTIGVGNVTHQFQGMTFIGISDADLLIRPGVSAALFPTLITHEIGHAIGFRHSDSGTPSSSSAIMTTVVNQNLGFNLQPWDQEANNAVYGSCIPPSIATQPTDVTITAGQQTTLSVTATGTSLTFQWYIGPSGTITTMAPNGTSNQLIVSPSAMTQYWVKVSGCSTAANSRTATVTVNQPTCTPPSAAAPNASPSSIAPGQSSTVSVNPSGTGPFSFQWFSGGTPTQGSPVGGSTPNNFITVTPSVTTAYSVRITGQCAPVLDTGIVTVTVACTPIATGGVGAQPLTINVGQSSTISVTTSGSGPFTFQWYRGSLGDTSNPIAIGSSTVVSPVTSTAYWVHVTAPCGSQDGSVTVFVNAPCTASSITTNPNFATIAPGGSATLSVVATGTAPISYQWYTGTSGNTASPILTATNASVTVSPAVTTSYWVRVSNSCNQTGNNSTTAVVVVSASCPAPTITTQPAAVSAPIGTVATLNVIGTVTGTTIHYQWYKGAKGDLSTKVGIDSATFTTGTVGATASYWVRLTSACNVLSFTDSNAAIVTAIAPPRGHAVRH
jgi:dual-action HEIGH metallo-peptidase